MRPCRSEPLARRLPSPSLRTAPIAATAAGFEMLRRLDVAALAVAAAGDSRQVSAFVPGPGDALAIAAGLGMRFTLPMVLMSDRDFGDWACYVPRNPGFM